MVRSGRPRTSNSNNSSHQPDLVRSGRPRTPSLVLVSLGEEVPSEATTSRSLRLVVSGPSECALHFIDLRVATGTTPFGSTGAFGQQNQQQGTQGTGLFGQQPQQNTTTGFGAFGESSGIILRHLT